MTMEETSLYTKLCCAPHKRKTGFQKNTSDEQNNLLVNQLADVPLDLVCPSPQREHSNEDRDNEDFYSRNETLNNIAERKKVQSTIYNPYRL